MRNISKSVFRNFSEASVTKADGTVLCGRGALTRMSEENGDISGTLFHELGSLDTPLYVFTGSMAEASAGDTLTLGGKSYRILKCEEIAIGRYRVGVRAVLEEKLIEETA